MLAAIDVAGHGLAALLFALLALWQARNGAGGRRRLLAAAFACTSGWALAVAALGSDALAPALLESARNLAFLGFMALLTGEGGDPARRRVLIGLYLLLGAILAYQAALTLLPTAFANAGVGHAIAFAGLALRMMVAVGALLLVHNIHEGAAPEARWGIRLAMLALGAMWAFDLNLYTLAYLQADWSPALAAYRGLWMAALAPLFALAARRNQSWRLQLSRAAAFRTLSLAGVAGYFALMLVATRLLERLPPEHLRAALVLLAFLAVLGGLVLLPTSRFRAAAKVHVAKHLFRHRYDYRAEWLRFTATLGGQGADAPLGQRVIKALADITGAPGGALLLPDPGGRLAIAATFGWTAPDGAAPADAAFGQQLERSAWILAFDELSQAPAPAASPPGWMTADPALWAAVPLIHGERLAGIVLLVRPTPDRRLDWEDFDLLRIAGRQVASHLAEAEAQEALSDARRFDEFNRRFAFIIHDVKNLVSQLSLVARNAERHADNPDFRADMVATLKGSVAKMNDLLARLSQHNRARGEEARPVPLRAFAARVAAATGARLPLEGEGEAGLAVLAEPARLEQAVAHLVQNAIEASPPGEPVWLSIERRGAEAALVVLDRGCGMSAEFVRTRLFKPFASTKQGGFGIGAFEARAIVSAMGGRLEVESREGEGSRFAVVLPIAQRARERIPA